MPNDTVQDGGGNADQWGSISGHSHELLDPVYQTSRFFLESIVQKPTIYDLDQRVNLTGEINLRDDWQEVAKHYVGFAVCAALGLVIFLLLVIGGAIFCCCRCCCSGGKKKDGKDSLSTGDYCCLVFSLLICGAMLMGTITMLVANSLVRDEIHSRNVYDKVQGHVHDLEGFINSSVEELTNTAVNAFSEVQKTVDGVGDKVLKKLNERTQYKDLMNAQTHFLNVMMTSSREMDRLLEDLVVDEANLKVGLGDVKDDIEDCGGDEDCDKLDQLNVDFAAADGLGLIVPIKDAAETAATRAQTGLNSVAEIESDVNTEIDKQTKDVKDELDKITDEINNFKADINDALDFGLSDSVDDLEDNDVRESIETYWDYWYYSMLALGIVMLIVSALQLLGVLCGLCGSSGNAGKGGGICSKSTSPTLLMVSVYIMLVFGTLISLISMLMLVLAGGLHTEVCRYFGEPASHVNDIRTIDRIIMKRTSIEYAIMEGLMVKCGQDDTLYQAFDLENSDDFDLDEVLDLSQYDFDDALDDLGDIDLTLNPDFMNNDTKKALDDLKIALGADLSGLRTVMMEKDITKVDLTMAAGKFPTAEDKLLRLQGEVVKMNEKQTSFIEELDKLVEANDNYDIDNEISKIEQAGEDIENDGEAIVSDLLEQVGKDILEDLTTTSETINHNITSDLARCGPLYSTTRQLLGYVCVDILYPLNAFWFGLGWFLVFGLVAAFISCHVSTVIRGVSRSEGDDKPDYYNPPRKVRRKKM